MTTIQKNNISLPAEGLLVFDTDVDAFYYYNTTSATWSKLNSSKEKRDNYVLVKSASDFPAASGGKITLTSNTLYEINGLIVLPSPIELNNAYLVGRDSNEDILYSAGGTIFSGTKGGSLRNLTLSAPSGTVFNIIDGTGTQNFVFQSAIVANSGSVGKIEGLNLLFMNVIQYSGNSAGVTYKNINNLLLNNQGWFGDNGGTYETLVGTFSLIGKVGGFSQVIPGSTYGLNTLGITSVTGDAVLQNVVFYGGGNYINGTSPYTGYNFDKNWSVNSPGIPRETDDNAAGNYYYNGDLTTGFIQTISNNNAVKITGDGGADINSTTATNLFRFTSTSNNRLKYEGKKKRNFQINASLSIRGGTAGDYFAFIIAKNGTVLTESNSIVRIENSSNIQNVAINATVTLSPTDYIEIFTQRLVGSGDSSLVVFSENISIK